MSTIYQVIRRPLITEKALQTREVEGSLVFEVAAGATKATFAITTSAVGSTTALTISATYNGTQTATLTVNPPTLSSVTLSPAAVTGGTSTTGTVKLGGAAPAGGASGSPVAQGGRELAATTHGPRFVSSLFTASEGWARHASPCAVAPSCSACSRAMSALCVSTTSP